MNLLEVTALLGNVGEFVGAIGVIVTLVYLSVQVRQNTRSLDISQRQAIAQTELAFHHLEMNLNLAPVIHDSVGSLLTTNTAFESLPESEQRRAAIMVDQHLTLASMVFRLAEQQLMQQNSVESTRRMLAQGIQNDPRIKLLWPFLKGNYDPMMVSFVEQQLAANTS